jgi:hypothetical protein
MKLLFNKSKDFDVYECLWKKKQNFKHFFSHGPQEKIILKFPQRLRFASVNIKKNEKLV